jgi:predicted GNAT superfamily acetyltransferase
MAPSDVPPAASDVVLRPLRSREDYDACVELQKLTWGRDFEVVSAGFIKISQKVGAVAAGAFAPDGRMLGFVYGLTGVNAGGLTGVQGEPPRVVHWSHLLAVDPEARDLRLGTRLKLYQRELLLPLGVEVVHWTYDPLEARNAHLNLNHLGAEPEEYVEEMYADEMGSELARGIGTDRFIVAWRIAGDRVREVLAGRPRSDAASFDDAPVVSPGGDDLPDSTRVRVEIPDNVQALKAERPEEAFAWRLTTRRAFQTYLPRGYRVEDFRRDPASGRCFYGLRARDATD